MARKSRPYVAPTRGRPALRAAGVTPPSWLARHGALVALLIVLAMVALVRLRIANVPLERDEGEYAYAGQLILQGIPPYELAYNMKWPGTYYAYSLILALFGQTAWGIHVGLLLLNAATALVVFFLGRRLIGDFGAWVGATAFAVLSLDRWTMGVFAHATHFALLPALVGLIVLLRAIDWGDPYVAPTERRSAAPTPTTVPPTTVRSALRTIRSTRATAYLGAGALIGTAILMKQQAVFFAPFALGVVLWSGWRRADRDFRGMALRTGLLIAGLVIPLLVLCGVLGAQGALGKFRFWTLLYARAYISEVPLSAAGTVLAEALTRITQANLAIWLLAAAGVAALWLVRWRTSTRVVLSGLLIASFLCVCPGFYFREHYFILLLPAVGLLAGVAVASVDRILRQVWSPATARLLAVVGFGAVVMTYVVHEQQYLFSMTSRELSRSVYEANPFVEAVDIARYIQEHTTPEDKIAVMGSEPEIYFYSHRKSATGYIYTYPLMEAQPYAAQMQGEMMHEVEAGHPKYLVFARVNASWLIQPASDRTILEWIKRYTTACYTQVGIADIHSPDVTTWRWGADVAGYTPQSKFLVDIFVQNAAAPCTAG